MGPSPELEQHRRQAEAVDGLSHRRTLGSELLHRRGHEDAHPLVRGEDGSDRSILAQRAAGPPSILIILVGAVERLLEAPEREPPSTFRPPGMMIRVCWALPQSFMYMGLGLTFIGIGLTAFIKRWRLTALAIAGSCRLLPVLGLVPFEFQNLSTVADRYNYLYPALDMGILFQAW